MFPSKNLISSLWCPFSYKADLGSSTHGWNWEVSISNQERKIVLVVTASSSYWWKKRCSAWQKWSNQKKVGFWRRAFRVPGYSKIDMNYIEPWIMLSCCSRVDLKLEMNTMFPVLTMLMFIFHTQDYVWMNVWTWSRRDTWKTYWNLIWIH